MSSVVVVGAQWGDEGKGKITNALCSDADLVVRFQGGANAGHTVSLDGVPIVFHLLPSGISVPGIQNVIGPGVVIDPIALAAEIAGVTERGVEVGENLLIDVGAHMVLPYHKALEAAEERARGDSAIGTTHRGIGPAYADRCARDGIPIGALAAFDEFRPRFEEAVARNNEHLTRLYAEEPLDAREMLEQLYPVAQTLARHLADTPEMIREAIRAGLNVLFEGAQGTLLDVTFGTYPFVTSSSTTAGGVATGTGVPPSMIGEVIGIAKAYTTRVGAGPFPTEVTGDTAQMIQERGAERGATTGRARRCGWLDIVALRYSIAVNGIKRIIVTKLDVLDSFETIKVCVAYDIDGKQTDCFPRTADELRRVNPVYVEMPGWMSVTKEARHGAELPPRALAYLNEICRLAEVDLCSVSVGAKGEAIVEFTSIF